MHSDLVLQALLSAVWRRRPERAVIVHSDQGSQYASDDWIRFCERHNLVRSMSRRGNAYDNAAMESFFASLKKERVRRQVYRTIQEARADLFDYIEGFYNRKRRHEHLGGLSQGKDQREEAGSLAVSTKLGEFHLEAIGPFPVKPRIVGCA